jgi:hypothetical protein
MDQTDIAIVNVNDDEDLVNYFEQKEQGAECSMTVRGTFLGLEEGNARISIESVDIDEVKVEEEEEEEEESESPEPTGAEMVLGKS